MTIVHTVASLRADHGGPSRSVPALCEALARRGAAVSLVTTQEHAAEDVAPVAGVVEHIAVRPTRSFLLGAGRSRFSRAVGDAIRAEGSVLHDHGLWLPTNHQVARLARSRRVPRIVSIRGMLTSWARRQRRYRKALAWRLYQQADLASACMIHVTSGAELQTVRALGLTNSIALIPNGVTLPASVAEMPERGIRTALFLSRLHPGKGAEQLVQAWSAVRPKGWRLVLAGPDVEGHRAELERAVGAADLSDVITFAGPVDDHEKWDFYLSADLFVLPTRSENFGLSIAEALAAGVPVITTTGAPWPELESHGCGWWLPHGIKPLADALGQAVRLDPWVRREMGSRGRRLVEERYAWATVAERMETVYAYLLGRRPRPAFVSP